MNAANRHLSMYDPATDKFTLIDTCFSTHHLIFAEDANDTLWTCSGIAGAGAVGWVNRKMFDETGDERTIARLDAVHRRHQRQRQARRLCRAESADRSDEGQARADRASTASRVNPSDGAVWGTSHGLSRPRRPPRAGRRPDAYRAHRNLPAADAGLRSARRRRRSQRRVLVIALERPSRQLRPPQVQGAQRADRHRQALPGRLDAPPPSRTAVQRRDRQRQRRVELLHLGRLVRHVRSGRERADRHRQHERLAHRAGRRAVR